MREANLDFYKYTTQLDIGFTDVVDLMSKAIHDTKDYYLNEIIENQCNVVLSTVIAKINENEIQYASNLVNAGYEMHYIFIYADYEKTVYRAKNRSQWTGRWFNEAVEKKEKWRSQVDFALQIFNANPLAIQFYNNTSSSKGWFMNEKEFQTIANK